MSGQNVLVPLANAAHKQGRIIADNICGAQKKYRGTPGTLVVKVFDLADLELAYAPPFSSAKDPVNLAGMITINQMQGKNRIVSWDHIEKLENENTLFIDVRTAKEFRQGHIPWAINIPYGEIRKHLTEIPKERKVVLYCYQGKMAYFALRIRLLHGFNNVVNLQGGYTLYKAVNSEQESIGIF